MHGLDGEFRSVVGQRSLRHVSYQCTACSRHAWYPSITDRLPPARRVSVSATIHPDVKYVLTRCERLADAQREDQLAHAEALRAGKAFGGRTNTEAARRSVDAAQDRYDAFGLAAEIAERELVDVVTRRMDAVRARIDARLAESQRRAAEAVEALTKEFATRRALVGFKSWARGGKALPELEATPIPQIQHPRARASGPL